MRTVQEPALPEISRKLPASLDSDPPRVRTLSHVPCQMCNPAVDIGVQAPLSARNLTEETVAGSKTSALTGFVELFGTFYEYGLGPPPRFQSIGAVITTAGHVLKV